MARPYRFIAAKEGVLKLHDAHPDWTTRQIADALDASTDHVRKINALLGLNIKPSTRGRRLGWRKYGNHAS